MYDGGDILTYKSLKEGSNFIFLILTSSAYFLMKPFPWEAVNIFQQIQTDLGGSTLILIE